MSWTTLDLNNLLAGEPLIESEVLALYENPIAIAQGAPGAPRVSGRALAGVHLGELARSQTTSPIGIIDLDRWDEILLLGSAVSVQISFTQDNGTTWEGWQQMYTQSSFVRSFGRYIISKSQGQITGGQLFAPTFPDGTASASGWSASLTIPASSNGFRLRNSSSDFAFNFSVFLIGSAP